MGVIDDRFSLPLYQHMYNSFIIKYMSHYANCITLINIPNPISIRGLLYVIPAYDLYYLDMLVS